MNPPNDTPILCPECRNPLKQAPRPCLHCGHGHPGSHEEAMRLYKGLHSQEISRRRIFLHVGMALGILVAAFLYKIIRPYAESRSSGR